MKAPERQAEFHNSLEPDAPMKVEIMPDGSALIFNIRTIGQNEFALPAEEVERLRFFLQGKDVD